MIKHELPFRLLYIYRPSFCCKKQFVQNTNRARPDNEL